MDRMASRSIFRPLPDQKDAIKHRKMPKKSKSHPKLPWAIWGSALGRQRWLLRSWRQTLAPHSSGCGFFEPWHLPSARFGYASTCSRSHGHMGDPRQPKVTLVDGPMVLAHGPIRAHGPGPIRAHGPGPGPKRAPIRVKI